jgi:hypothetical protein
VNFCKENSENPELTDRQAKKLIHWRVPTFLNTKNVCVCVCVCDGCFPDRVSQAICQGWLRTTILLIFAS